MCMYTHINLNLHPVHTPHQIDLSRGQCLASALAPTVSWDLSLPVYKTIENKVTNDMKHKTYLS